MTDDVPDVRDVIRNLDSADAASISKEYLAKVERIPPSLYETNACVFSIVNLFMARKKSVCSLEGDQREVHIEGWAALCEECVRYVML